MSSIISILKVIIFSYVIVMLIMTLTYIENYFIYYKVFKSLKGKIFKKAINIHYNQVEEAKSGINKVIWFANDDDFKVKHNTYLHNNILFFIIMPLDYYFWRKYKKYFHTNYKHLKI